MSEKALLIGVVAIVVALGAVSALTGLDTLVRDGQLSGRLFFGLLHIGLAIWLYRGSNAARLILAALYGISVVLAVAVVLLGMPPGDAEAIIWSVLAVVAAAVLWVLLLSKPFRAALAANAERFRQKAAEPGQG